MTNQTAVQAIMELFKEIEKSAADEMFPWQNEINSDLEVFGYYLVERKKR